MAVANYHDTYGVLPPAYIADAEGKPMHSWRVLLLPFIEERKLYAEYDFSEPWDGPNNRKLRDRRPSIYAFHGNQTESPIVTNYLAVVGAETAWPRDKTLTMHDIEDGGVNTILIVENHGSGIMWTEPSDLRFDTMNFEMAAESADGISSRFAPPAALTVGGFVNTVALDLPPRTLRALLTANGGELADFDGRFREIADGRNRPVKPEK